jgi:plastocyanin
MKRLLYIERLAIALMLLLLLAFAPAHAQTPARTGETTTLEVEQKPGDTYQWELYSDSTVNFAVVPGDNHPAYAEFVGGDIGSSVNVLWKIPGTYFYKVTAFDAAGCTVNFKMGKIKVILGVEVKITPPSVEVCAGDTVKLELKFIGTAPWNFTYTGTDINGVITTNSVTNVTDNPYTLVIVPGPTTTSDYTVIRVSDIYGTNNKPSNTVTQIVNPLPLPNKIYHR